MKAALLCPGPSLRLTYEPGKHDLVIGINRAALAYACSWWCFTDEQVFRAYHYEAPVPLLGLCYSRAALDELLRRKLGDRLMEARQHLCMDDLSNLDERVRLRFPLFSAPAGLMLALYLGAKTVDVYGADWTDEPDFDGARMQGAVRDEARWANEIPIWDGVVAHLASRRLKVRRIRPDGPAQRSACA